MANLVIVSNAHGGIPMAHIQDLESFLDWVRVCDDSQGYNSYNEPVFTESEKEAIRRDIATEGISYLQIEGTPYTVQALTKELESITLDLNDIAPLAS